MGKIFFQMPCLSESREIKSQEIYERLFDKRVDRRYLESSVQKFLLLNKKMFSFLGIELEMNGTGHDLSIIFKTAGNIGAIPIKMPYDGISHKDFQITPRFDQTNNAFSDLTQMLSVLEYSISPEYADGEQLSLPLQLRPPMYYEAAKYIDLFELAFRYNWVKFEVVRGDHKYPKSNTDWSKHALRSSDPSRMLEYPSSDSILSVNHREWQQLKYVFDIAKSIILQPNVPGSIRYKYFRKLTALQTKVASVCTVQTSSIAVHANDPHPIKEVKIQANALLQKGIISCVAWRMDMAQLFERYIQHVASCGTRGLGAVVKANAKIRGRGQIAQWGLKYLEPDLIIKLNNKVYMADAKCKVHYYAFAQKSEILKEIHRADLHQILAYCSFSPEKNKTGILFYPSSSASCRKIDYLEQIGGINNTVFLIGLPFGINEMDKSVNFIRRLFLERIF